jgi:hypothetical protein
MNTIKNIALLAVVILLASLFIDFKFHFESPERAGNDAADFARQFVIAKDTDKSYKFFHDDFKKVLPVSEFSRWIETMKKVPSFERIQAVSYSEIQGQKGNVIIYLEATRVDNDRAYMSVSTYGNGNDGYKVVGLKTLDETKAIEELPGVKFKTQIVRGI